MPSLLGLGWRLAAPVAHRLDPETANGYSLRLLEALAPVVAPTPQGADEAVECMGLRFRNRIGTAAGLDKDGLCIEGLSRLGFGFLELGTVTPRPCPGAPKPRVWRLGHPAGLFNKMGFPNAGADALRARIASWRQATAAHPAPIIGVNIGKHPATPVANAPADYVRGARCLWAVADYLAINISSPNSPGLRQLGLATHLQPLLAALDAARLSLEDRHRRTVPLVLKCSPDMDAESAQALADTVNSNACVRGLIMGNSTSHRSPSLPASLRDSTGGGTSGTLLSARALAQQQRMRRMLSPDITLIAAGGLMGADDVARSLGVGCALAQLYTGLVFAGPRLVAQARRAARTL